MARLTRHIYPGLFCGIIIMILCGLPGSYFHGVPTNWAYLRPDKIVHGIMFAAFSFSIIWGYRREYCEKDSSYRNVLQLVTFFVSISYGALTEIIQCFLPDREANIYDFLADVIGCVLGILIFKIIFRKKMIKK
ncbi:MAG: VanZ family protein [Bacteroidales bacterium]|nr:VanZ family protein [Bacteroidales bacterium]